MLAQAKALHHAGQLRDAAGLYRNVLAADPAQVEAQYLLGAACHAMGQLNEAAASLGEALRLRPDLAEVHHQLGIVLAESHQPAAAERCIRRALELKPHLAAAHHDLGVLFSAQNRVQEAADAFRRVVELKPHDPVAHADLGAVLEHQDEFDAAVACFHRALEIDPAHAEAHSNLGSVLGKQRNFKESETSCRRAIELNPQLAEAHNNLGAALHRTGRFNEAAECLRTAIRIKPENAQSHNGLGAILTAQGRLPEAFASFRQALRLDPEHADAHFNYAFSLLLTGQLAEGWPELEWRFRRQGKQLPDFGRPRWAGEELAGRTILLHSEQGLGDTLQFIRYAESIAERGGQVILEVQRPLLPLLQQSGFRNVIAKGGAAAPVRRSCTADELAGTVRRHTRQHSQPRAVSGGQSATDRGVARTLGDGGLKVGIAWQGNPDHDGDRFRSIPLVQFARLAGSGIELISLQKGAGREQLAELGGAFPVRELEEPIDERHGAFMDTAAIIQNLDLVVTCDTAIAHLAGAQARRSGWHCRRRPTGVGCLIGPTPPGIRRCGCFARRS